MLFGCVHCLLGCFFLPFLLLIFLTLSITKNFRLVTKRVNADWIMFLSARIIMFLQFSLLIQELTTSRLDAMGAHMLSFEYPPVNVAIKFLIFTLASEFLFMINYLIDWVVNMKDQVATRTSRKRF